MKIIWRWLAVLIIISMIYILSDIPNLHLIRKDQIPLWLQYWGNKYVFKIGTTGYFSYMLSLQPDFILHKIGHIVAFGTLGVSIYWATNYSGTWAVLLTAIVAACDERHQFFVPGRSSRFGDVVLDTLAAIIFIFTAKLLVRKCQNPSNEEL